jgi:hypothetical protein
VRSAKFCSFLGLLGRSRACRERPFEVASDALDHEALAGGQFYKIEYMSIVQDIGRSVLMNFVFIVIPGIKSAAQFLHNDFFVS